MPFFSVIRKIPVIGTICYIANSYFFAGDARASKHFATPGMWIKALWIPVLISIFLTGMVLWPMIENYQKAGVLSNVGLTEFARKPAALIFSVVPSLLGFGIGVYALIFALAEPIVRQLHKSIETKKKAGTMKHGSVLLLNSDFAYPLIVLVGCITLAVFQSGNPSVSLLILTWLAFWYSMIVVIEVIGVLFGMGDNSLLEKAKDPPPSIQP